jgi:superfamily II DNA or RNA helicase
MKSLVEPRRWQSRALDAWVAAGRRGIVQVVTGGGKTVFAQLCMANAAEAYPDLTFIVVVPTQALLDQWYVSFREDLGLSSSDIALYSGRGLPTKPALVNVMVVNTARHAAQAIAASKRTMLVVDEVHRVGSEVNARAMAGSHIAALGMSATPEREYDTGFETHIAPALGDIIFRYGLNEARADGVISQYDLINVSVDLLSDEKAGYDKLSRRIARMMGRAKKDPSAQGPLDALLRQRARLAALASMRLPVAVKVLDGHRGVRAIVFHEDIAQANRLLERLLEGRHRATIYHSRISASVRRDNLRLFRRGTFDILVTCRALDEGVNIPETQVAIIASATASSRQRIQRLGRVLRPAPGKCGAIIYTIYATPPEEARLAEEAAMLSSASSVAWRKVRLARG